MLFHFLHFCQCVCLSIKLSTLYKSQSPLQREIFHFKKICFQELQRTARLDYQVYLNFEKQNDTNSEKP